MELLFGDLTIENIIIIIIIIAQAILSFFTAMPIFFFPKACKTEEGLRACFL